MKQTPRTRVGAALGVPLMMGALVILGALAGSARAEAKWLPVVVPDPFVWGSPLGCTFDDVDLARYLLSLEESGAPIIFKGTPGAPVAPGLVGTLPAPAPFAAAAAAPPVLPAGDTPTPFVRQLPAKEAPAANPGAKAPAGPPKATTLVVVLGDLRKEATDAWLGQKPWPRDKANYAQDKNVTLPNDDLVRVLIMHLSDTAPIDGYIRWQLLSFNPDLSKLDVAALRKLVAMLPKVAAQPDPPKPGAQVAAGGGGMSVNAQQTTLEGLRPVPGTGQSRPTLGVVTAGTSMGATGTASADNRYVTLTVEAAQANLVRLRQVTVAANVMPLAFRNGILDTIPKDGGMRAFARIEDLKRRMVAGDESFAKAAEKLFAETAGQDVTVSADLQKPILGGLRVLAQLHTTVIESFETQPNGKPGARALQLSLPVQALAQAAADLRLENASPFPGP